MLPVLYILSAINTYSLPGIPQTAGASGQPPSTIKSSLSSNSKTDPRQGPHPASPLNQLIQSEIPESRQQQINTKYAPLLSLQKALPTLSAIGDLAVFGVLAIPPVLMTHAYISEPWKDKTLSEFKRIAQESRGATAVRYVETRFPALLSSIEKSSNRLAIFALVPASAFNMAEAYKEKNWLMASAFGLQAAIAVPLFLKNRRSLAETTLVAVDMLLNLAMVQMYRQHSESINDEARKKIKSIYNKINPVDPSDPQQKDLNEFLKNADSLQLRAWLGAFLVGISKVLEEPASHNPVTRGLVITGSLGGALLASSAFRATSHLDSKTNPHSSKGLIGEAGAWLDPIADGLIPLAPEQTPLFGILEGVHHLGRGLENLYLGMDLINQKKDLTPACPQSFAPLVTRQPQNDSQLRQ